MDKIKNEKSIFWLNFILLKDENERDEFLKIMNEAKVMTRPIWQLMFRLPIFQNYKRDARKNTLYLEERIVNISGSIIHQTIYKIKS